MKKDKIKLNPNQEEASKKIVDWFRNNSDEKQTFTLAGYAGTGKTFLVKYIVENLLNLEEKVAFVAPTGKAASVLVQRGAKNATTIHRLIYTRIEHEVTVEIDGKKIKNKKVEFIKKTKIPNYKLIVVDEASMVDLKIMTDLLSFGIPLLCVGDPGQLEAIFKSNDLLEHPDYTLTELVRQEEDNPIVKLATMARNRIPIPEGDYGNVKVIRKETLTNDQIQDMFLNADQILSGANRTAFKINECMKRFLNMKPKELNIGEKVICLLNNWEESLDEEENFSLVNGTIGFVKDFEEINTPYLGKMIIQADFLEEYSKPFLFDTAIFSTNEFHYKFHDKAYYTIDGKYEVPEPFKEIQPGESKEDYHKKLKKQFRMKKDALFSEQINFFQDAWCISVHKSQGSEWNNGVVIDESYMFDHPEKWLYTAITRFKKSLIILI